jgi:hypothetical protein
LPDTEKIQRPQFSVKVTAAPPSLTEPPYSAMAVLDGAWATCVPVHRTIEGSAREKLDKTSGTVTAALAPIATSPTDAFRDTSLGRATAHLGSFSGNDGSSKKEIDNQLH